MKTFWSLLLALALAAPAAAGAPAPASDDVVIVVSSYSSPESLKTIGMIVNRLLLSSLPGGTGVSVWDGFTTRHVFERVEIPKFRYDSPEARVQSLAVPLVAMKKWAAQSQAAAREKELAGTAAIRLPEMLDKIAPFATTRPTRILILASPLYRSLTEKSLSMVGNLVPSDGTLDASREANVYGTRGREHALAGITIYWGFGPEVAWANEAYGLAVRRWWSIWAESQKGEVVGLVNDLDEAATLMVAGNCTPREHFVRDENDTVVEMRPVVEGAMRVKDLSALKTPPAPPPSSTVVVQPIPIEPLSPPTKISPASPLVAAAIPPEPTNPAPPPPLPPTVSLHEMANTIPSVGPGKISLAALWETDRGPDSGVDLDLYVQIAGVPGQCWWKSPVICKSKDAPAAHLLEDIRKANGLGARDRRMRSMFECVEINKKVEPGRDVSCWIDVYENRDRRPIRALVRMEYNGKIYEKLVNFPAIPGDMAAGRETKNTRAWQKIDLSEMIAQGPIG